MSLLEALLFGNKPENFFRTLSPPPPLSPCAPSLGSKRSCRAGNEIRDGDTYEQRAQEALQRICRYPYLPGMIRWLESANPGLYGRLSKDLPERITALWDSGAPLEQFQAALENWVMAHRNACYLYEQSHGAKDMMRREIPSASKGPV